MGSTFRRHDHHDEPPGSPTVSSNPLCDRAAVPRRHRGPHHEETRQRRHRETTRNPSGTASCLDIDASVRRENQYVDLIDSAPAVTFPIRRCRHHMRMGAVGVKGKVLDGTGASGVSLDVKSDAMWVGTKSSDTSEVDVWTFNRRCRRL